MHDLLDAGKEGVLSARDVPESQLERTVQAVLLGLSLDQFEHALRIDLVLFLEQNVAAAGAGVDFADAEGGGSQFQVGRAEQGLREKRDRTEPIDPFHL